MNHVRCVLLLQCARLTVGINMLFGNVMQSIICRVLSAQYYNYRCTETEIHIMITALLFHNYHRKPSSVSHWITPNNMIYHNQITESNKKRHIQDENKIPKRTTTNNKKRRYHLNELVLREHCAYAYSAQTFLAYIMLSFYYVMPFTVATRAHDLLLIHASVHSSFRLTLSYTPFSCHSKHGVFMV